MGEGIYVGLATTSHNDGVLTNAEYENVEVIGAEADNEAPTAVAEATPLNGTAPLQVTFNGGGSSDPESPNGLVYAWEFGNGDTSSAADPVYTYTSVGSFTATLTVTDPEGQQDTASVTITVDEEVVADCTTVPSPWTNSDIGNVAANGGACFDNGRFEVEASGADIFGSADEFHYVYQELQGDGEIVAQLMSLEQTNGWAKAGVMMRGDLDANSAMAMMIMAPDPNNTGSPAYSFQYRSTKGGNLGSGNYTAPVPAPGGYPHYLRLVRSGDTFTAYVSETNGSWLEVGNTSIPMGEGIYVGLATTSHNDGVLANAVYENVEVIGTAEENEDFSLRINAGGPEVTYEGNVYAEDQNFTGGKVFSNPSAQVPTLYQTERSAFPPSFSYNIPLEDGDYNVILHFAEIYWGATDGGAAGVGKRVFDVVMEGITVLNNYDINALVGPQTVVTENFIVTIQDGALNINFDASDGTDQPKLSAIEILSVSGSAPLGPLTLEESEEEEEVVSLQDTGSSNKFSITPNPTSVETSLSFELPTTIEIILIYDLSGRVVQRIEGGIIDDTGMPINVQELPVGVYLLKAKDKNGEEYQQKLLITGN